MDYAQLQQAVADFLNRNDLAAQIPTFIALAEAQMQRDVRHWRGERVVDIAVTGRFTPLPADYAEMMALQGDVPLSLVTGDEMRRKRQQFPSGGPRWYAITGGQLEVWPVDGSTIEATYRAKIPPAQDTGSNWLLALAPDVYLYGSLIATAPFLIEDERIAMWSGLYQSAINALNDDSNAGKFPGRLVMRKHYG